MVNKQSPSNSGLESRLVEALENLVGQFKQTVADTDNILEFRKALGELFSRVCTKNPNVSDEITQRFIILLESIVTCNAFQNSLEIIMSQSKNQILFIYQLISFCCQQLTNPREKCLSKLLLSIIRSLFLSLEIISPSLALEFVEEICQAFSDLFSLRKYLSTQFTHPLELEMILFPTFTVSVSCASHGCSQVEGGKCAHTILPNCNIDLSNSRKLLSFHSHLAHTLRFFLDGFFDCHSSRLVSILRIVIEQLHNEQNLVLLSACIDFVTQVLHRDMCPIVLEAQLVDACISLLEPGRIRIDSQDQLSLECESNLAKLMAILSSIDHISFKPVNHLIDQFFSSSIDSRHSSQFRRNFFSLYQYLLPFYPSIFRCLVHLERHLTDIDLHESIVSIFQTVVRVTHAGNLFDSIITNEKYSSNFVCHSDLSHFSCLDYSVALELSWSTLHRIYSELETLIVSPATIDRVDLVIFLCFVVRISMSDFETESFTKSLRALENCLNLFLDTDAFDDNNLNHVKSFCMILDLLQECFIKLPHHAYQNISESVYSFIVFPWKLKPRNQPSRKSISKSNQVFHEMKAKSLRILTTFPVEDSTTGMHLFTQSLSDHDDFLQQTVVCLIPKFILQVPTGTGLRSKVSKSLLNSLINMLTNVSLSSQVKESILKSCGYISCILGNHMLVKSKLTNEQGDTWCPVCDSRIVIETAKSFIDFSLFSGIFQVHIDDIQLSVFSEFFRRIFNHIDPNTIIRDIDTQQYSSFIIEIVVGANEFHFDNVSFLLSDLIQTGWFSTLLIGKPSQDVTVAETFIHLLKSKTSKGSLSVESFEIILKAISVICSHMSGDAQEYLLFLLLEHLVTGGKSTKSLVYDLIENIARENGIPSRQLIENHITGLICRILEAHKDFQEFFAEIAAAFFETDCISFVSSFSSKIIPAQVLAGKFSTIQELARISGKSIFDLFADQLHSVLCSILMKSSDYDIISPSLDFLLVHIFKGYTLRDLISNCRPLLLFEIFDTYAKERHENSFYSALWMALDPNASFGEIPESGFQLSSEMKSSLCEQFMFLTDKFNETFSSKGNHSISQKKNAIFSLKALIQCVGSASSHFVPKILSTIRILLQQKHLCTDTLYMFQSFLDTSEDRFLSPFIPEMVLLLISSKRSESEYNQFIADEILDNIFQNNISFKNRLKNLSFLPEVKQRLGPSNGKSSDSKTGYVIELLKLLSHHSVLVKKLAVSHLKEHFETNWDSISEMYFSDQHFVFFRYVLRTLTSACTEENEPIHMELCHCLGLIGSLDPSRIGLIQRQVGFKSKSHLDLSVEIIETHLIKHLQYSSETTLQNKALFAIQELLKVCDLDPSVPELFHQRSLTDCESSFLQNLTAKDEQNIQTWSKFKEGTRHLINPCLRSSLVVSIVGESPSGHNNEYENIYDGKMGFTTWISRFTRVLIGFSDGPMKNVFNACWSIARHDADLCSFLLPYLFENILILNQEVYMKSLFSEVHAILDMFPESLGARNATSFAESNLYCIALFRLFDQLDAMEKSHTEKLSSQSKDSSKKFIVNLNRLKSSIELRRLAIASFTNRRYRRAFMYFEKNMRQIRRNWMNQTSEIDADLWKEWFINYSEPIDMEFFRNISLKLNESDLAMGIWMLKTPETASDQAYFLQNSGEWSDALTIWEQNLQSVSSISQDEYSESNVGYLKCLFNIGHFQSIISHSLNVIKSQSVSRESIAHIGSMAAWRVQAWNDAEQLNAASVNPTLEVNICQIISTIANESIQQSLNMIEDARKSVWKLLIQSNTDSYEKSYDRFFELHVLTDIEVLVRHSNDKLKLKTLFPQIYQRMQQARSGFHYREKILSYLRVLYNVFHMNEESELATLKLAQEARNDMKLSFATSSLLHMKERDVPAFRLEKSKLLHLQNKVQQALSDLQDLIQNKSGSQKDEDEKRELSKVHVLIGKWIQDSGLNSTTVVNSHYKRAAMLDKENGTAFYMFANCLDKIFMQVEEAEMNQRNVGNKLELFSAIVKNYAYSVVKGNECIYQSLPRLVTLWLNYSDSWLMYKSGENNGKSSEPNPFVNWMKLWLTEIAPYKLFVVLPQIISRICCEGSTACHFVNQVLTTVTLSHPQQALWFVGVLNKFSNRSRRTRFQDIFRSIKSKATPQIRQMIDQHLRVFSELTKICEYAAAKSTTTLSVSNIARFLHKSSFDIVVPTQNALTVTLPSQTESNVSGGFSEDVVFINQFNNEIKVLSSKERPKTVSLIGSDGVSYKFLCKKEKDGDIRKNSRMMELSTVVNRLLRDDMEARNRNLSARTYSVIALTEECGILEWVNHTTPLKHVVHSMSNRLNRVSLSRREIESLYLQDDNLSGFRTLVHTQPPVLDEWFFAKFPNPDAWFSGRLRFTRSCAAWSMIGYIVGLGDRHGENILLDKSTGDCVHVDFECLFDAGKLLTVPEVVPFRLTQNMVDAMGITGYEGSFRICCEIILKTMRNNQDALMSVLDSFVQDPLLDKVLLKRSSSSNIMSDIGNRLRGVTSHQSLPLSIKGQVQHLIDEATSHENLSSMYIWWMPWM